jgi:abelson tyrosine-protein kinase 1
MQGAKALTQEMDIYAFAICCWEILMMGELPWQFMDDNAVRHSVLSGYPLPYCSAFSP